MNFKIVTAVTTEPVTLAEARLALRLTDDDPTDEDSLITAWITAAREIAEHYTGRALAAQTLEAALDAFPCSADRAWRLAFPHGDFIDLPRPPVASITSVKYTDTAGVEQTISSSAYALSPYGLSNRIAPTYGNYWPSTQRIPDAVRIRYVTGYGASGQPAGGEFVTVPKSVKSAILLMVVWFNEHRGDEMDPNDIQPPAAKALLNTVKVWGR
jgi:uncharacterized phiE125 gp8 family phage protein